MAGCSRCDRSTVMNVSVISVFAFLALVSVILRLWARKIKTIGLELNDYLCIGGLIFALALSLISIHSYIYWGFFSASVAGQSEIVAIQYKALLVGELTWVTAVTLIRASVILLYIRIFPTTPVRVAGYGVLTVNLAYFIATVLACCLICRPLAYSWDNSIDGKCGDAKSLDMFIGVFNLLMDVVTVVLPMPVLWGLQMPTGRKVILSGLFSMGITICVITLVRIQVTTNITPENLADKHALITLLTCLETTLGVVNACLPVTKPVFENLRLKSASLMSALSGWTSIKRNTPSGEYEMPSKSKQIGWPLEDKPKRIMQQSSQESVMNIQNAV